MMKAWDVERIKIRIQMPYQHSDHSAYISFRRTRRLRSRITRGFLYFF